MLSPIGRIDTPLPASEALVIGLLTFIVVILVITIIGVLACWIPARRAVRIEPMIALRHE